MRVSAKADYAIRAAVELAAAGEGPVKGDRIAKAHPELTRQQQAAAAIADSRARLANGVAIR